MFNQSTKSEKWRKDVEDTTQGMAGRMAQLQGDWKAHALAVEDRLDKLENESNRNDEHLESKFAKLDERLAQCEETINAQINEVRQESKDKFDSHHNRVDNIQGRVELVWKQIEEEQVRLEKLIRQEAHSLGQESQQEVAGLRRLLVALEARLQTTKEEVEDLCGQETVRAQEQHNRLVENLTGLASQTQQRVKDVQEEVLAFTKSHIEEFRASLRMEFTSAIEKASQENRSHLLTQLGSHCDAPVMQLRTRLDELAAEQDAQKQEQKRVQQVISVGLQTLKTDMKEEHTHSQASIEKRSLVLSEQFNEELDRGLRHEQSRSQNLIDDLRDELEKGFNEEWHKAEVVMSKLGGDMRVGLKEEWAKTESVVMQMRRDLATDLERSRVDERAQAEDLAITLKKELDNFAERIQGEQAGMNLKLKEQEGAVRSLVQIESQLEEHVRNYVGNSEIAMRTALSQDLQATEERLMASQAALSREGQTIAGDVQALRDAFHRESTAAAQRALQETRFSSTLSTALGEERKWAKSEWGQLKVTMEAAIAEVDERQRKSSQTASTQLERFCQALEFVQADSARRHEQTQNSIARSHDAITTLKAQSDRVENQQNQQQAAVAAAAAAAVVSRDAAYGPDHVGIGRHLSSSPRDWPRSVNGMGLGNSLMKSPYFEIDRHAVARENPGLHPLPREAWRDELQAKDLAAFLRLAGDARLS